MTVGSLLFIAISSTTVLNLNRLLKAALLLLIFIPLVVRGQTIDDLNQQLNTLRQQRAQLEKQAAQLEGQLQTVRQQAQTLRARIKELNLQIQALEARITTTQNQIQINQLTIRQLEQKIARASRSIEAHSSNLLSLLKTLYISQNKSPLEIFLSSATFGEYFQDQQYLRELELRFDNLLRQLKIQRLALSEAKKQKQQQLRALDALERQLDAQQLALEQQSEDKKQLLIKTQGQEASYKKMLSEIETQKAKILSDIRQIEKQIALQKSYLKFSQAEAVPPVGAKLLINPLPGSLLTQGYGMTSFAKRGVYGGAPHNGLDLAASAGSAVRAAADGVIFAKGSNSAWGNWVAIQHLDNLVSLYAHLIKPSHLSVDQAVSQGDTIGYEGATGFTTGAHLHFSLYKEFFTFQKNGSTWFNYFEGTLNPLDYMKWTIFALRAL